MLNLSDIKISYKKVLCSSVLFTSFFVYTPVLYMVFNETKTANENTIVSLKNQTNLSASKILGVGLSLNNHDLINATLDSLISYSYMYSLTVRDNYNEIIAYSINDNFDVMEIDQLRVRELPIYSPDVFDVNEEKIRLGMLVISASPIIASNAAVSSPLYKALLIALLFSVITAFLFALVFKSFKHNLGDMVSSVVVK